MPRTCSPTSTAGAFPPQPAAPNLILPSSQLQIGARSLGIDGHGTRALASSDAQQLTGGAQLERVGQNKNRSKLLESVMLDAPIYDSLQQLPEQTLRKRSTSEPLTQRLHLRIHMRSLGLKPPYFLTVLLALSRAGCENTLERQNERHHVS